MTFLLKSLYKKGLNLQRLKKMLLITFTNDLNENTQRVLKYLEEVHFPEVHNEKNIGEIVSSFIIHYKEGDEIFEETVELGEGKYKSAAFLLYCYKTKGSDFTAEVKFIAKDFFTDKVVKDAISSQGASHHTVWLLLTKHDVHISFNFK